MKKFLITILALLFCTACGQSIITPPSSASAQEESRPLAIIGTFPLELKYLESQMTVEAEQVVQGRRFLVGQLEGHRVVVTAVGVGSVNASAGTALLIDRFNPRAVILNGVAGGLGDAQPGDVVVATSLIHYGFGQLTDEGYSPWPTYQPDYVTRNPLYFTPDPNLLNTAQTAGSALSLPEITINNVTTQPKVIDGIIESEDIFSEVKSRNEEVRLETGCNTFEEEGAPVAQVCSQLNMPFLIVRGISNRAEEDGFETFQQLSGVAAENANRLVIATLNRL